MSYRRVAPRGPLRGVLRVPGDKSISHRALILGALGGGMTRLRGLGDGDDVRRTAACLSTCGVSILASETETFVTPPTAGWREPADVLDCGNSGTTARLLLGVLASSSGHAVVTGDASLRRRPMGRVVEPLRAMGAHIDGAEQGSRLPLSVHGAALAAHRHDLPVASAQVKSALLFAGRTCGVAVREPAQSRDPTERLLSAMGAELRRTPDGWWDLCPGAAWGPLDIEIPGDLSAAAFWLVAASIVPGSDVVIENVGLNPTRTGVLDVLRAMGAAVEITPLPDIGPEPAGFVRVRSAPLRGISIGPDLALRAIDELPVLAVAAAFAEGETVVSGAAELRVKESDRIRSMVIGLRKLGAEVEERPDGFVVLGRGGVSGDRHPVPVGGSGDHRLAMSFAVAGLAREGGVAVIAADEVHTSYPRFFLDLESLT